MAEARSLADIKLDNAYKFGAGRYLQEAGALNLLGGEVARLGKKALVIAGPRAWAATEGKAEKSLKDAGVEFELTYAEGGYVDDANGHLSSKGLYKTNENGEIMTEDDCYIMEDKERFGKDMSELLNIETEVEIHTVSISVVEKCDEDPKYDSLTMAELDVIDFMLAE